MRDFFLYPLLIVCFFLALAYSAELPKGWWVEYNKASGHYIACYFEACKAEYNTYDEAVASIGKKVSVSNFKPRGTWTKVSGPVK